MMLVVRAASRGDRLDARALDEKDRSSPGDVSCCCPLSHPCEANDHPLCGENRLPENVTPLTASTRSW